MVEAAAARRLQQARSLPFPALLAPSPKARAVDVVPRRAAEPSHPLPPARHHHRQPVQAAAAWAVEALAALADQEAWEVEWARARSLTVVALEAAVEAAVVVAGHSRSPRSQRSRARARTARRSRAGHRLTEVLPRRPRFAATPRPPPSPSLSPRLRPKAMVSKVWAAEAVLAPSRKA